MRCMTAVSASAWSPLGMKTSSSSSSALVLDEEITEAPFDLAAVVARHEHDGEAEAEHAGRDQQREDRASPARRSTPRATSASAFIADPQRAAGFCAREERRLERDAVVVELLGERRPDAGRRETAAEATLLVDAGAEVERVDVLEHDHVALHAHHLAHVGDAAGAVPQSGQLHDHVERRGHLLPDDAHRQVHARHQRHGLDPGERVAR